MPVLTALFIAASVPFPILPAPDAVNFDPRQTFAITPGLPVVIEDHQPAALTHYAGLIAGATGYSHPVVRASAFRTGDKAVYVGVVGQHPAFDHRRLRRAIRSLSEPGPGGYRLIIDRHYVLVAGTDEAGAVNGMRTLLQIARRGAPWPCLTLRDSPHAEVRGVIFSGPPSPGDLTDIALLKATHVAFDSSEFYALDDQAARRWASIFNEARMLGLEPVPVVRTLSGAGTLTRAYPMIAATRVATEAVVLSGDNMALLSRRHIVDEPGSLSVRVSGIACREDEDFVIERNGDLVGASSLPWTIRRIPGGAIPDGASVEVEYLYRSENAEAVSFQAPETPDALAQVFRRIRENLDPLVVYLFHDDVEALARDGRTRRSGQSLGEAYLESVHTLARAAGNISSLWLSSAPIDTWATLGLETGELCARFPEQITLVRRGPYEQALVNAIPPCAGRATLVASDDDPPGIYAWSSALAGSDAPVSGLLIPAGMSVRDQWTSIEVALAKSWSPEAPVLAWPEGLNRHVGATLWQPSPDDVRQTLIAHLNRETLRGNTPDTTGKAFDAFVRELSRRVPPGDLDVQFAAGQMSNLVAYLEFEAAYANAPSAQLLRRLVTLVDSQAAYSPNWPDDRRDRIVETVQNQRLFVPSSILFGGVLYPYRPYTIPAGHHLLAYPDEPEYAYRDGVVEAVFSFAGWTGAVARIDFQSAQIQRLRIERGDASGFTTLQTIEGSLNEGVVGPVILSPAPQTSRLRLVAEGPADRTVLRDVRAAVLKGPAAAVCPLVTTPPRIDGTIEPGPWPEIREVNGFVQTRAPIASNAQTDATLCRTRTALYIGLTAHEPRMDTMLARLEGHDAPLWEEESIEVRLKRPDGAVFRFLVNPNGARYDSRNGDSMWDSGLTLSVRRGPSDWSAELAIPFADLGGAPASGTRWGLNVVRYRYNVVQDVSTWVVTESGTGSLDGWGTLVFP